MADFAIRSPTSRHAHTNRQPAHDIVSRIFETLLTWHMRSVQRDQLAHLSEYQLRDIGLSRSMIHHEIEKPFWRA